MTSKQLHVALLASPGMGHLVPILLLGHNLVTHHNLRVTVLAVTATTTHSLTQFLTSFTTTTNLSIIQIPVADVSSVLPKDAKVITQICVMMRETIPAIRTTLSLINPRPHVLIGDIFSTESWQVAEEFKIPKYVFVTGSAWFTALFVYSLVLDKQVVGQYVDQKEPFEIPGCKPVRPEDVVDPMPNRFDEAYKYYLDKAIGVTLADGMLINTWEDFEPQTLDALRNNESLSALVEHKPVYTVGPVCKRYEPEPDMLQHEVVKWLDEQPDDSVVYVSFGSGGVLSVEEIHELAWGLEMSGQRFVWVVRPPVGHDPDSSFLKYGQFDGPCDYLPKGFLSRTEKVGFVVPSWAPQVEILNHVSVGGFVTHCGWNSVLESITSGVPMIVWPLYAEQRMNATMLTKELNVAVRPEVLTTKKVVGREEIARLVVDLVKGERGKTMKMEMNRLKEGAKKAISENGSSYLSVYLGGNPSTTYMLEFGLLGGATGLCSLVIGFMHHRAWRSASLASASSSAFISWAITAVAFGFVWKEIKMGGRRGKRLQTLELFITISTFSQMLYLMLLHAGVFSPKYGPDYLSHRDDTVVHRVPAQSQPQPSTSSLD